jgi:DNA-binding MarR family transcriptional regulator
MLTLLLERLDVIGRRSAEMLKDSEVKDKYISRSGFIIFMTLAAFAPPRRERTVSEIASELKMSTSSAHRYIKTLVALGLLEQNQSTQEYHLAVPDYTAEGA